MYKLILYLAVFCIPLNTIYAEKLICSPNPDSKENTLFLELEFNDKSNKANLIVKGASDGSKIDKWLSSEYKANIASFFIHLNRHQPDISPVDMFIDRYRGTYTFKYEAGENVVRYSKGNCYLPKQRLF